MAPSSALRNLQHALSLNQPESSVEHVVVALPSFGMSESTLAHYAERIPALEHRFLNGMLMLGRISSARLVYLCSKSPGEMVLDYYFNLLPDDARARFDLVEVHDLSPRSLAHKLLEQPAALNRVRELIGSRPAFVDPWNVTGAEVAVARLLGIPCNGTPPELWPLGFKSSCRRIFRHAEVPVPFGFEDIRTLPQVRAAIETIRTERPHARGVVIKHDNSGSGDGNAVIKFASGGEPSIDQQLDGLPGWYLDDLDNGGVVEELISGEAFSSPSAQVDILPDRSVIVRATHEQVLGGADNQVYLGCRFPASAHYAGTLAHHAAQTGRYLAQQGVIGRFSVDFVAVRLADGQWDVRALEVNLRKGGTTHPYSALRNLVPGRYDPATGQWLADHGGVRCYSSTDNLVRPEWRGRDPQAVIETIASAGLAFDRATQTGVVLHMLTCLAIDGRFGLTAIAETTNAAEAMVEGVVAALA